MENATTLRSLKLINTPMSYETMEHLASVRQLTKLEYGGGVGLTPNCDFVLKFESLVEFKTFEWLDSSELAEKAFWNLKELTRFEYKSDREPVKITRHWSGPDQVKFVFEIGNMMVAGNNKLFECGWLSEGRWPIEILRSGQIQARIFWRNPPPRVSKCLINQPESEENDQVLLGRHRLV